MYITGTWILVKLSRMVISSYPMKYFVVTTIEIMITLVVYLCGALCSFQEKKKVFSLLKYCLASNSQPRWVKDVNPVKYKIYTTQVYNNVCSRLRSKQSNTSDINLWASLTAQSEKNLPAMQETWVRFLGWEDSLEKEMAIQSSILAWKIP